MRAVPSLDQLARDPSAALGLPPAALTALHMQASAALSAIGLAWASSAQITQGTSQETADADQMLTVDEAAELLRRKRRWISRHAATLPFVRRLTPRSLLCSRRGVERWLAARRA